MPVTKEEFLARMAAGRAKKAAERAASAPAATAPAPKPKKAVVAPVTTIRAVEPAAAPAKTPRASKPKIIKGGEPTLA